MNFLSSLGMTLWQADVTASSTDVHWIMIAVVTIALVLVLVLLASGIAALAVMKEIKHIKGIVTDVQGKAMPIIQKTQEIITDLQPKIRTVSENVTQVTYTVRGKVDEVGETVSQINRTVRETNQKTRGQVDHVDRMVSNALSATEDVSHKVVHGVKVPLRQVAGVVAGLRVGLETLVANFSKRPGGPAL